MHFLPHQCTLFKGLGLFLQLSFYLTFYVRRSTGLQATNKSQGNRHLLDIVLEGYDLDKWPTFYADDPDNVTAEPTKSYLSVDIMFISSINVEAMDLTIDMYLNQKWNDKRLRFPPSLSKRRLHLKTVEQMRRIWSPDTYIVNAKQANFHHITTENRVVYISGNGDVFYSARITAKVACEMKFHSFPMDNQECELHLASYAYTVDILQMFWLPERPVSYKIDMDLNQFHLTNVTTIECVDMYPDGGFPCLKINFRFERRVAHHLIQTFLPTVLIVTISWVSFYIQAEAVPARIALGITTLLTMITLNSGTKQGLPPVSYVKAIDVWMGVCTFFVFSAIWEYVVVCILARRPLQCSKHDKFKEPLVIRNRHADADTETEANSTLIEQEAIPLQLHHPVSPIRKPAATPLLLSHNNNALGLHCTPLSPYPYRRGTAGSSRSDSPLAGMGLETTSEMLKVVWEPRNSQTITSFQEGGHELTLDEDPVGRRVIQRKKRRIKVRCSCTSSAKSAQERSKRVDILARFAYPLMFLIFNLLYWPYYLILTAS